jgi:hypothetical protein
MQRDEVYSTRPMQQFSPELERELTLAMRGYAVTLGATSEAMRLQTAMQRVCTEARQLSMPPERMVVELKRLYHGIAAKDVRMREQLRDAYDRLLSGCIRSYFAASAPSPHDVSQTDTSTRND